MIKFRPNETKFWKDMAYQIQLELFEKQTPFTMLEKRVSFMDKKLGNVQRGLFARIGMHDDNLIFLLETVQKQQLEIDTLKKKLGFKPDILEFTLKPEDITTQ